MSKQNKFFAVATTAALVASAIVPVASAAEFKDANQIAPWAKEAVETLADKGVIGGNPDGSFNPKGNVTRAEAAKMFTMALNLPVVGTESFTDVKDGQWFQDVIIAVSNAGIVDGMGNGLFVPNGKLTRAEAAKMIVKAYGFEGEADLSKFADANAVAGKWFEAPLSTAVAAGIIAGKGNLLAPNDSITRQEFAVMLTRAIDTAQEDNAEELLADVEKATTALDTAVKALNTEVKAEEVDAAKAEVKTAKEAVTALEKAVADAKDVITTEASAKAKAAIETAKKAIATTEAAIELTLADPKVSSVEAINATQVEVKFNKAVDAKSVFADGKSGAFKQGVITIRSIDSVTDGTLSGELSADGKVLTVTSTQLLEKRYDVVVDKLTTTAGETVEKFNKIISINKDVTAPTVLGTELVTANQLKIKFSEPMASAGSTTFKLADGTVVTDITGQGTLVDGGKAVILDLSDVDVPVSKDITATIIGAADKAGNLLNPNPATVTFQKGAKDGVAPTVSSVSQTGAKTFEIKFSEAVVGKPTVAIDSQTINAANVVIDPKDATKVTVTTASVLEGDKIVTISNFVDGSGEVGAATNRVVKFVKDTAAPQLVSTAVVTDATDKAEYLEFTFDKDVVLTNATVDATGSYVKNYVTNSINATDITATAVNYKDAASKKVIRVKLADLLGNKSVEGAQYSLDLAFSGVANEAAVATTAGKTTFTRGTDGTLANTDVIALAADNAIVQSATDNSTLVVNFDKNVDAASATNVANYIVGGAVVESATVSATDLTKVTLKLKADSNTFTGVRNVTVQNVKAAGSTVAMTTTTKIIDLKENVAPTVTAQLQADLKTIKLTFSENVFQASTNTADFGVFVGTDAYKWDNDSVATTPLVAFETDSTLTTDVALAANTVNIVLPTTVTAEQLSKGLTLKALATMDVKDAAGNKLNVPASLVVSNN
ncbi:S-layer homology domain-containing protein [Solibacillus sp. FSL W7-1464]|uniref:S-layer homology domain-containing protein n=1 Tax=Solibacillus sp. FSL W7-1464 TaxID=2921706 RepID=UPI0030FBEB37